MDLLQQKIITSTSEPKFPDPLLIHEVTGRKKMVLHKMVLLSHLMHEVERSSRTLKCRPSHFPQGQFC